MQHRFVSLDGYSILRRSDSEIRDRHMDRDLGLGPELGVSRETRKSRWTVLGESGATGNPASGKSQSQYSPIWFILISQQLIPVVAHAHAQPVKPVRSTVLPIGDRHAGTESFLDIIFTRFTKLPLRYSR